MSRTTYPCVECGKPAASKRSRCWTCYVPDLSRPRKSREDRFWSKVDKRGPDECWPWIGAHNHQSYGILQGWYGHRRAFAHRVSLEMAGVEIPAGMNALHRCDNPPCVNPRHLYVGTFADNTRDMMERGRHRSPVSSPLCPRGHDYAEFGRRTPSGSRWCLICHRDRARRIRAAARQVA